MTSVSDWEAVDSGLAGFLEDLVNVIPEGAGPVKSFDEGSCA